MEDWGDFLTCWLGCCECFCQPWLEWIYQCYHRYQNNHQSIREQGSYELLPRWDRFAEDRWVISNPLPSFNPPLHGPDGTYGPPFRGCNPTETTVEFPIRPLHSHDCEAQPLLEFPIMTPITNDRHCVGVSIITDGNTISNLTNQSCHSLTSLCSSDFDLSNDILTDLSTTGSNDSLSSLEDLDC